jgi:hypothetical protein
VDRCVCSFHPHCQPFASAGCVDGGFPEWPLVVGLLLVLLADVIYDMVQRACQNVRPDVRKSDKMDIRNYVKVRYKILSFHFDRLLCDVLRAIEAQTAMHVVVVIGAIVVSSVCFAFPDCWLGRLFLTPFGAVFCFADQDDPGWRHFRVRVHR